MSRSRKETAWRRINPNLDHLFLDNRTWCILLYAIRSRAGCAETGVEHHFLDCRGLFLGVAGQS